MGVHRCARDGARTDIHVGQPGINFSPACAVIGPGKEILAGDGKDKDRSIRQAGIDRRPACAIIRGKKNAAAASPGKSFVPETAEQLILPPYGPLVCSNLA